MEPEQLREYPPEAVERAKNDALEWLGHNSHGYPRSWEQEAADEKRRGYAQYDDFQAPPIAGYEALEREGRVVRREAVTDHFGGQRIKFAPVAPSPA